MIAKTQEHHFTKMVEQMHKILISKGGDYANEDRLSNFKLAGSIIGLTPEMNCLSLIATKVARLGVLLNSDKDPNNESINDSIIDLANYAVLLSMIVKEREPASVGVVSPFFETSTGTNTFNTASTTNENL
jgi:hypothetical protein